MVVGSSPVVVTWNLVASLIRICRIQWCCSLFSFSSGNTLFGQIWSKNLKLSVSGESWYLDWFEYAEFNAGVHLFRFQSEMPFLGKFGRNCQNCQFKVKLGIWTNSNMQNSMMMFTLFVFDHKYPFWSNLAQKNKIVSFKWNLILRLIRICRIQCRCSLFLFSIRNAIFGQIWSKLSILSV